MALHPATLGQRATANPDLVRVLVILAAVIALMLVATVILGMQQSGPLYEIVPDPAHLSGLAF